MCEQPFRVVPYATICFFTTFLIERVISGYSDAIVHAFRKFRAPLSGKNITIENGGFDYVEVRSVF